MEIYDYEGNPRDEQWLEDEWGIEITKPPNLQSGERYFKLQVIRFEDGPCATLFKVYDEDPGPMEGILVAWRWTDAPSPPESGEPPYTTPVYPHDWYGNFVFGATNVNGDWGGAMGSDTAVPAGTPGPYQAWLHHAIYRSDLAAGLGWRAMTHHRAPRLHYYLVMGEEPPPEVTIDFRADDTTLISGESTTLRWDVENATEVYLDDEGVVGHGTREVSPTITTTYTLTVHHAGGITTETVIITVSPSEPEPPGAASRIAGELRALADELEALDALAEDLARRL